MFVSPTRVYVKASRGLGQLMGVARKRTRYTPAESCVAYVETGTNS